MSFGKNRVIKLLLVVGYWLLANTKEGASSTERSLRMSGVVSLSPPEATQTPSIETFRPIATNQQARSGARVKGGVAAGNRSTLDVREHRDRIRERWAWEVGHTAPRHLVVAYWSFLEKARRSALHPRLAFASTTFLAPSG